MLYGIKNIIIKYIMLCENMNMYYKSVLLIKHTFLFILQLKSIINKIKNNGASSEENKKN